MLKRISMALAILFAGIIVTVFPAMSEVNQPDASEKEQQMEDGNQSGVEEVDKKKGHHRHGDMRRKGRQMLNKGGFGGDHRMKHKSRFEGRRRDRSDAGYRGDDHRKHPGRGRRMSQDRRFRDRRSPDMVKGKSGRLLPLELTKRLTVEQRQEVRQAVEELRQQHHRQMKSTIAGLLKEYSIELPESKEKKPVVDK
ncbi:TPA: hypothetical protein EYN98_01940 [Candidatus Poribacteria bacterium]|nr:hypothetical protein [Candidatus Poribacteria bacterium]